MPKLLDEAGWQTPASAEQVAVAVSQVVDVCEPDADDHRIVSLTRLIKRRGYTAAELSYAAGELPFDEFVNAKYRYGRSLLPADFERVIEKSRKHRALVRTRIPSAKLVELLAEHSEFDRGDFGTCPPPQGEDGTWMIMTAEARKKHGLT